MSLSRRERETNYLHVLRRPMAMRIILRKEVDPDPDFYCTRQFQIYREPSLIWSRRTWERIVTTCDVYRIEIDGQDAGEIILENRRNGITYVADFGLLPEYRAIGVGRAVLEKVRERSQKLSAFTRKETLGFFLKSGFIVKRTMKDYFSPGSNRYYLESAPRTSGFRHQTPD